MAGTPTKAIVICSTESAEYPTGGCINFENLRSAIGRTVLDPDGTQLSLLGGQVGGSSIVAANQLSVGLMRSSGVRFFWPRDDAFGRQSPATATELRPGPCARRRRESLVASWLELELQSLLEQQNDRQRAIYSRLIAEGWPNIGILGEADRWEAIRRAMPE